MAAGSALIVQLGTSSDETAGGPPEITGAAGAAVSSR